MTIAEYFAVMFSLYLAGMGSGLVIAIVKNYHDALSSH